MAEPRKSSFLRSRGFLIGGTIAAVFIAISAGRELYANYTMQKEIRVLEQDAARLESRRLELLELAKKFESGEFLETQARLELGLQKPGERVVVVQPGAGTEPAINRAGRSNPQLWWDYFVHRE